LRISTGFRLVNGTKLEARAPSLADANVALAAPSPNVLIEMALNENALVDKLARAAAIAGISPPWCASLNAQACFFSPKPVSVAWIGIRSAFCAGTLFTPPERAPAAFAAALLSAG
jgi:hypothetical protein